jgi:predicted DNA-binding protein (UPF0251 family)
MTPRVLSPEADRLVDAAYGLALRATGDEQHARASVEAAAQAGADCPVTFLSAVRREARARRTTLPLDPATAARPSQLADMPIGDWEVLERVALRGLTLAEAAAALGLDRREVLLRLNRAMQTARRCLVDGGHVRDDADPVRLDRLRGDPTAGRLDDAPRNREAETAAARGLPA